MTDATQRPSAQPAWYAGEYKDAIGGIAATDAPITEPQTVVAIGNRVPVVFGAVVNSAGGVWVTPPAARYGINADEGNNIVDAAVGLVVSDGEIGAIAGADVYRGAIPITRLHGGASVFRYNGMPDLADGFNYVISGSTVGSTFTPLQGSVSWSSDFVHTTVGTTSIKYENVLMRERTINTTMFFSYKIYVNDALVASSSAGVFVSLLNWTAGFPVRSNVRLELRLSQNPLASKTANVYGSVTANAAQPTGIGASPISGSPISGGEGGSFSGLSCLAAKGQYLYTTSKKDPSIISHTQWKSAAFNPTYVLELPRTRMVEIKNLRGTDTQGGSLNFEYKIYVNGVLVQSEPGTAGTGYPSQLSYERAFPSPTNVKLVVTRYNNSYYRPPFTLTAGELSYTDEQLIDTSMPMTFTDAVRCFVRNGIKTYRLVSKDIGSSNNFADLLLYLLRTCGKVPDVLIDMDSFTLAARFCSAQGFTFNGVVAGAGNLREWAQAVAPLFLLQFAQVDGRFALLPLLPLTADLQLSAASLVPAKVFTEVEIIADSYRRTYTPASERTDAIALITWRDQTNPSYAVSKVEEVQYAATPSHALRLQIDMESFCVNAGHALVIGKYTLLRRKLITHMIELSTTIEHAGQLKPQDVITVTTQHLSREWYMVKTIADAGDGLIHIAAEHFPVDGSGRPLLTLGMEQPVQ